MLTIQKQLTAPFYMLLSLPATAMGLALSIQIAALSWILSTQYHLEIEEVGLVWAAGPIAGILGQVIIGFISDKVWFWNGRRRPFMMIGGLIAGLMLLALPNIDIISDKLDVVGILGIAIIVALTLDLSINVSFNPTRSIIADVTPEGNERTKGYTWMQTVSGSLSVGAYGIGAWMGNYVLIYLGAGLVMLFSILPPLFIEEPKELKSEAKQEESPSSIKDMLLAIQPLWGLFAYNVYGLAMRMMEIKVDNNYAEIITALLTAFLVGKVLMTSEAGKPVAEAKYIGFKKVLAAHSFTWIGVQTMIVYLFAYFSGIYKDSLNSDELGFLIAISFLILNAIGAVLPALVLEPMSKKIGRVKVHTLCVAIMAVGYALIYMLEYDKTLFFFLVAILGIGWAAIISLPFAIMSEKVDKQKMGLYMGLFNLSVVLPQLVASLGIGTFVSKVEDKSVVFLISAIFLAVSAICWAAIKEDNKHK